MREIDNELADAVEMYEDEMPADVPESVYDHWFSLSRVENGVRIGPVVAHNPRLGYYILTGPPAAELARREQAQAPQHAPGPWTTFENDCNLLDVSGAATVWVRPQDDIAGVALVFGDDIEEAQANAALIARAPDLLAENERLRAKLAEGPPQNVHQYKSALANMEQTINDLHRKNDSNNALMTEAAQKIDELRAERDNARRVAVTMGNERSRLESILDDLQAECVRRSDTIHGLTADNARLRSLLAGILRDLPVKRDWLDPDIEQSAKEAING